MIDNEPKKSVCIRSEEIEIVNLSEHPHLLPVVAAWLDKEWSGRMSNSHQKLFTEQLLSEKSQAGDHSFSVNGSQNSQFPSSPESRLKQLDSHLGFESIPCTFVLVIQEQPLGCVSLIRYQSSENNQIGEWLTNLYVCDEIRGQGRGRQLVDHLIKYADSLDVGKLYLYTTEYADFYVHLGWRLEASVAGELQILTKDLSVIS